MEATTYAKLDYSKVVAESPLAIRALINWFCSKEDIVNGFGAIEGEGDKYKKDPRLMREMMAQVVPAIIQNDPRKLYEFLDDNKIRISIQEHPSSTDETPLFTYYNSKVRESGVGNSRHEAEQLAFYAALKLVHISIQEPDKT